MNKLSLIAIGSVAAALVVALAPPAYGAQSCSFGGSGGLALTFPRLDPSAAGPPTLSATFVGAGTASATWGNCAASMSMTATSGTTNSNVNWAMQGPGGATIAYSVTTPTGKYNANSYAPFALSAQVLGSDYANAVPGDYRDNLVITVIP